MSMTRRALARSATISAGAAITVPRKTRLARSGTAALQHSRLGAAAYGRVCPVHVWPVLRCPPRDLRPYAKKRALYVYSTTILSAYEDSGFGKILKAYVLGRAVEAGYRWVVGHAKEGASLTLNQRFGAKIHRRHTNWFGTGDPYRFYSLKLR